MSSDLQLAGGQSQLAVRMMGRSTKGPTLIPDWIAFAACLLGLTRSRRTPILSINSFTASTARLSSPTKSVSDPAASPSAMPVGLGSALLSPKMRWFRSQPNSDRSAARKLRDVPSFPVSTCDTCGSLKPSLLANSACVMFSCRKSSLIRLVISFLLAPTRRLWFERGKGLGYTCIRDQQGCVGIGATTN